MEHRAHAVNIPMPQYNVSEVPDPKRKTGAAEVYNKLVKDLVDSNNKNMCLNYDTPKECHSARNTITYIIKKNEYPLTVYERNSMLWVVKNS